MDRIIFDSNASPENHIKENVLEFVQRITTLEQTIDAPIIVFQRREE